MASGKKIAGVFQNQQIYQVLEGTYDDDDMYRNLLNWNITEPCFRQEERSVETNVILIAAIWNHSI